MEGPYRDLRKVQMATYGHRPDEAPDAREERIRTLEALAGPGRRLFEGGDAPPPEDGEEDDTPAVEADAGDEDTWLDGPAPIAADTPVSAEPPPAPAPADRLLSMSEVAARLGTTRQKLRRRIGEGRFPEATHRAAGGPRWHADLVGAFEPPVDVEADQERPARTPAATSPPPSTPSRRSAPPNAWPASASAPSPSTPRGCGQRRAARRGVRA